MKHHRREPARLVYVPSRCEHGNPLGVKGAMRGSLIYSRQCVDSQGRMRPHVAGFIKAKK